MFPFRQPLTDPQHEYVFCAVAALYWYSDHRLTMLTTVSDRVLSSVFGHLVLQGSNGKPFHYLASSLSSLAALLKTLPPAYINADQQGVEPDWSTWLLQGGLDKAAKEWMAGDDMAAWAGASSVPTLVKATGAHWSPASTADFLSLVEIATLPAVASARVKESLGKEPSQTRGASYEEWSGYDPEDPYNHEDWWKDGGREGIAESKAHQKWTQKSYVLSRCYNLFFQIFKHSLSHRSFCVDFLSTYDASWAKVEASMSRYVHVPLVQDGKVTLTSPRGKLVKALLTLPEGASDDTAVQLLIGEVVSKSVGSYFLGDDRGLEWYDELLRLQASSEPAEHHFPSTLKPPKRAKVHELAGLLGLKHYSEGMEVNSQQAKKNKRRLEKKGETVIARHVVVKNF